MSLISMPEGGPRQSYENLILKTDSDEDSESDEQLLMRASVDFLAKFWDRKIKYFIQKMYYL